MHAIPADDPDEAWCALRALLGCHRHQSIDRRARRVVRDGMPNSRAFLAARAIVEAPSDANPWSIIHAALEAAGDPKQ